MTPQDEDTFRSYANSEIVRLMKQRVKEWMEHVYNRLKSADRDMLQLIQGEIRGLDAAINLMDPSFRITMAPREEEKPMEMKIVRPMVRNTERKVAQPEGAGVL